MIKINTEFGSFLRNLRKNKGLTLKELGKLSGLSYPYLSQIERGIRGIKGVPSPEILKKLSEALNVSHFDLMAVAGYYDEDDLLEPIEATLKDMLVKSQSKKTEFTQFIDLENILQQTNLRYKNKFLLEEDRKRILDMLNVLFPEK